MEIKEEAPKFTTNKEDETRKEQIRLMSNYASEIRCRLPRYYHLNELSRTSKDVLWFSITKGQYRVEFKIDTNPYALLGDMLRKLYNQIVLECIMLEEHHIRNKLDEGFRNPTIKIKEVK